MAGYVYGGNEPYKPRKIATGRPATGLTPFDHTKCGHNSGYSQHLRHGQKPCDRCHEAHRAYDAEYRAAQKAAGIKRKAKRQ